jgi:hypothetical protein
MSKICNCGIKAGFHETHPQKPRVPVFPFKCLYDGKSIEVESDTTLHAQIKALKEFQRHTRKKVQSYDITVMRADIEHVAVN